MEKQQQLHQVNTNIGMDEFISINAINKYIVGPTDSNTKQIHWTVHMIDCKLWKKGK